MDIGELRADLQDQHDKTTARAGELRDPIDHVTAALAETEARLADLATTRKIIAERVPPWTDPDPPETNTAYQAIVNAFNQQELPGPAERPKRSTCSPGHCPADCRRSVQLPRQKRCDGKPTGKPWDERPRAHRVASIAWSSASLSSRLRILPVAFMGRTLRNSTRRGYL